MIYSLEHITTDFLIVGGGIAGLAAAVHLRLPVGVPLARVPYDGLGTAGFALAIVLGVAALARGAKTATLVDHKTSGDTSGDYDRVVGYAGVIVR